MIEESTGLIRDFKNTRKEDRPWAREIMYIAMCIAVCMTTFFVFQTQKSEAVQGRIKAETELAIQVQANLKDNKDFSKAVLLAQEEAKKDCETQLQIQRTANQKYLEDKAARLEQELNSLRNESRKIRSEAKTIKQKVGI